MLLESLCSDGVAKDGPYQPFERSPLLAPCKTWTSRWAGEFQGPDLAKAMDFAGETDLKLDLLIFIANIPL